MLTQASTSKEPLGESAVVDASVVLGTTAACMERDSTAVQLAIDIINGAVMLVGDTSVVWLHCLGRSVL